MKVCRDCNVPQDSSEYYVRKKDNDSIDTVCKSCRRENAIQSRLRNRKPPSPRKLRKNSYKLLPEGLRRCGCCEEVKEMDFFYVDLKRPSGVKSHCKVCISKKAKAHRFIYADEMLAYSRKWNAENADTERVKRSAYWKVNRHKKVVIENLRRARKKALPDTLTHSEMDEIREYFGGKCALCESTVIALDHFVPLVTETCGTTKENIIPLCPEMNSSKGGRNPFEWSDANLDESTKERFKKLVEYLSDINGLTVEQYREFVFSCFKTKIKQTH